MTTSVGKKYDVIVIGAGHNGLTVAAYLAKRGRSVCVLERRSMNGGLAAPEEFASDYQSPGLLHDTSRLWNTVVEDLKLAHYGLQRAPSPPSCFLPQRPDDGEGLLIHADVAQTAQEIRAFSTEDADSYVAFCDFIAKLRPFVQELIGEAAPAWFASNFSQLWPLLKKAVKFRKLGEKMMLECMRIVPMCIADWLDEWFGLELLKAGLAAPGLHATFHGPRSPGSNLNLLLRLCTQETPVIGAGPALIHALKGCAEDHGVELRTEAEVSEILLEGEKVRGVKLNSGEELEASVIAASCDPKQTFLQLLPARQMPLALAESFSHIRTRGSSAKMHLALNKAPRFACRPSLEFRWARIGESLLAAEKAFDAIKYRRFSQQPLLEIFVPSIDSAELAPPSHHVMSIMIHFAPYELEGGWNDPQRQVLGERVIDQLQSYIPDLKESIVANEVLSPLDIERRYQLTGGHLDHGEHAIDQLLLRPNASCARYTTPFTGLYLCGSGSHPGGGLTCRPGALAAKWIEKEAW